mmetsp:Transcript_26587/g.47740  ORF Transcript_26587/g.47740 Transcript_26587/m.47740 type:complete len:529 (+) Transcript_26587:2071-3657(+)
MYAFTEQDSLVNPQKDFWREPISFDAPMQSSGALYHRVKNGWKLSEFALFNSLFFQLSNKERKVKREVDLSWKVFEPFVEEIDEEIQFGFRLVGNCGFKDFYCKSQTELEEWFFRLSSLCIMVDMQNDYYLCGVIGTGTFASVCVSYAKHDASKYAAKLIDKHSIARTNRGIYGVISEIEIMRSLSHPMLVKLHRVYDSEENIRLILDYVPHKSLTHKILEHAPFSERASAKFISDLLEVLHYIHSQGIVHRDLKPDNILMMSSDPDDLSFKIADFGLASRTSDIAMCMICGSPGYVAPEVLKRQSYDTKVDLFSAGIILHVMLSGHPPFISRNSKELIKKNRDCRIVFRGSDWLSKSRECIDFLLRLTEPDPSARMSAREAMSHPWLTSRARTYVNSSILGEDGKNTLLSRNFMRRLLQDHNEISGYLDTLAGHGIPGQYLNAFDFVPAIEIETKAVKLFKELRDSDESKRRKFYADVSVPSLDVADGSIDEKMEKMVMDVKPPGMSFTPSRRAKMPGNQKSCIVKT